MDFPRGTLKKRYNFFITDELEEYVMFIQRVKHIPMSTYMRLLIESAMSNDTSYRKYKAKEL